MNQKQAHSGALPKDGASSSREQVELGHCLVTGAAGFLGSHLVQGLLTAGYRVRALIHNTPLQMTDANLELVSGSVEDAERMQEVSEGIDTVFHTAARLALLGGRAATEAYRHEAYRSNVDGTMNIIRACQRAGVGRLVYTSSIDVCFDGVEDVAMNENTPYATFMSSVYTETKIAAERLVRGADGQEGLHTVALRPAGIYGAGNNVMLDEVVKQVTEGRLVATIAGPGAVGEHIFVENLVHAEILAAKHLHPGSPVCGSAYFVTDGHRAPFFEFVEPLVQSLGHSVPKLNIPHKPLLWLTSAWQYLHFKLGLPEPVLGPHEIRKVAISHCGTNAEATRDFGYEPIATPQDAMKLCIEHYQAQPRP